MWMHTMHQPISGLLCDASYPLFEVLYFTSLLIFFKSYVSLVNFVFAAKLTGTVDFSESIICSLFMGFL